MVRFSPFLLLPAALVVIFAAASRAAYEPEEILHKIERRYGGVGTLTAEFVQKEKVATLGRIRESRGRLYLKKPGKMKWEYSGASNQVIVSDGKILWIYYPEEKTAYRLPLGAEELAKTPLALIFQEKPDLGVYFRAAKSKAEGKGIQSLDLVPLEKTSSVSFVSILVNEEDGTVLGTVIRDAFGNQTDIRLERVSEGPAVDDRTFLFEPPPGTRIEAGKEMSVR